MTLALGASVISGCATNTVVTDTSCSVFGPITYSSRDTTDTVRQINEHNSVYACVCDKDCPKK